MAEMDDIPLSQRLDDARLAISHMRQQQTTDPESFIAIVLDYLSDEQAKPQELARALGLASNALPQEIELAWDRLARESLRNAAQFNWNRLKAEIVQPASPASPLIDPKQPIIDHRLETIVTQMAHSLTPLEQLEPGSGMGPDAFFGHMAEVKRQAHVKAAQAYLAKAQQEKPAEPMDELFRRMVHQLELAEASLAALDPEGRKSEEQVAREMPAQFRLLLERMLKAELGQNGRELN